jgi:hypothetical protein
VSYGSPWSSGESQARTPHSGRAVAAHRVSRLGCQAASNEQCARRPLIRRPALAADADEGRPPSSGSREVGVSICPARLANARRTPPLGGGVSCSTGASDPKARPLRMALTVRVKRQRISNNSMARSAAMMNTAMRHTIKVYSIAAAPSSSFRRRCHVWTPPADQGLFLALRGSWVRSCLRPHMRAPPSIVFLPMAIRGELSFPQGIPC